MIKNYTQFNESERVDPLMKKITEFAKFVQSVNDKIDMASKYSSGLRIFRSGASEQIFDVNVNNKLLIFDAIYLESEIKDHHRESIKSVIEVIEANSFGLCIQYKSFKGDEHRSTTGNFIIANAKYVKKDNVFVFDKIEADDSRLHDEQYSMMQDMRGNLIQLKDLKSIIKWADFTIKNGSDEFKEKWKDKLNGIIPFNMKSLEAKLKDTSFNVHDIRANLTSRKFGL